VLAIELLPGLAQELAPPLCGAQLLGQLIAPRLAEPLILGLIGRPDLGQDLKRDLLKLEVDIGVGVARDPGAIDRHHPGLHQASLMTELQHISEQPGERPLVAADEPRDRHMIRNQVAGDHPKRDVLATMTLDPPRRTHTGRKRIQGQPHHHRRLVRRPAMTVSPIGAIEPSQLHVPNRAEHKPRQVIRRKPIPHVRRQQKPLLPTTLNEVLRHERMVRNAADGPPFVKQPPSRAGASVTVIGPDAPRLGCGSAVVGASGDDGRCRIHRKSGYGAMCRLPSLLKSAGLAWDGWPARYFGIEQRCGRFKRG
jgi:hypothetical protein